MTLSELIGSSARFQAVLDDVTVVAPSECAVLVYGETGTGKEVIARAIHDSGPRQNGPFVALNCAAIPAALLESELFGHERGAFTGAITQTVGRFQAANGGRRPMRGCAPRKFLPTNLISKAMWHSSWQ